MFPECLIATFSFCVILCLLTIILNVLSVLVQHQPYSIPTSPSIQSALLCCFPCHYFVFSVLCYFVSCYELYDFKVMRIYRTNHSLPGWNQHSHNNWLLKKGAHSLNIYTDSQNYRQTLLLSCCSSLSDRNSIMLCVP